MAPARRLLATRALIDRRFAEPLDVRALARAAGLSPAHFSREFRRAFGAPPHRYLADRRMDYAARLLRSGEPSVAEVCRAVGMHSVGSFTTRFTRTFGIPPAAYRAVHGAPRAKTGRW